MATLDQGSRTGERRLESPPGQNSTPGSRISGHVSWSNPQGFFRSLLAVSCRSRETGCYWFSLIIKILASGRKRDARRAQNRSLLQTSAARAPSAEVGGGCPECAQSFMDSFHKHSSIIQHVWVLSRQGASRDKLMLALSSGTQTLGPEERTDCLVGLKQGQIICRRG